MRTRNIYNLENDSVSIYASGEDAEHDLVTEYMLNNNLASQIDNDVERGEIAQLIQRIGAGGRTLCLGDFSCRAN